MWKYSIVCTALLCISQARDSVIVKLVNDGPTVQGGSITFRVDLYNLDGSRPSGTFIYTWKDNGVPGHRYESPQTKNTTSFWNVDYPTELYPVGDYSVEVVVQYFYIVYWRVLGSQHKRFEITPLLNGKIMISQSNHTLDNVYVSSAVESVIRIDLRDDDLNYIMSSATEISTFWFIDCKYYGQTNDFTFRYNFTQPDVTKSIEALVIASYDPIITTVAPPNTTTTVLPPSNSTTTSTLKPITSTTLKPQRTNNTIEAIQDIKNISLPYVCVNSSVLPPDPKKTYGYFHKDVNVTAPIRNITVEGTNWIKPWEMLNLSVSCHGSGPFIKCLEFHRGNYNITGNETCINGMLMDSCNFSIIHFFLEPNIYTILVILKNDISAEIYPLTINIYEVTSKPQLSVIVVPVSCSLAAVVLIVFGIAYYVQSRARFTVEVADFDFGQNNPDMEYKTFTERLRDSFNSTVSYGFNNDQPPPYYGSMNR